MSRQILPTTPTLDDGVREWLRAFSLAVRSRDYDRGAALFDGDVVGFGTVALRADGIDALSRGQWRHAWSATEGFEFDWDGLCGERRGDRAWIAATWSSTGLTPDGGRFPRSGRSTIVLARGPDGRWRAVHSHFSFDPPAAAAR